MPPLTDYNITWETLFSEQHRSDDILSDDYFAYSIAYLEEELTYYEKNICKLQKEKPVEVLFFYNAVLDFIQHFQMQDRSHETLKKCLVLIDTFVGNLLDALSPENVILMSDHGTKALEDFFPNTPINIQKEAFGWTDKSVWTSKGQIATQARNGAFMSGIHDIKGCFIAAGNRIKHGTLNHMRTIDFYPTLLEMFDIQIPEGREGFVLDIFLDKSLVNTEKFLNVNQIKTKTAAIIQNMEVSEFNRIINEVFLDHRFTTITIIGEAKYKNIFLGNPCVSSFIEMNEFKLNLATLPRFDTIFTGYRNLKTKQLEYISLLGFSV